MQTLAKFQVEKTAFGAAVRQLLVSQAGIDASSVSEGDKFAVWPAASSSDAFDGISPLLAVVSQGGNNKIVIVPSQPSELRAATMQWCNLAAQLASQQVSFMDVEARINIPPGLPSKTSPFVTGTEKPSAADLLLLSSLKGSLKKCKVEAPNLFKWAEKAIKGNEVCQQFCSLDEMSSNNNNNNNDDNNKADDGDKKAAAAGGKPEFAIPNAAEIAARRAAKEQAKKEKAEKEAAAKAAAGGGADAADAAAGKGKKAASTKDAAKELTPDEGLDLRVGRITAIDKHPSADKLYLETIDLGPSTTTTSSASADANNDDAKETAATTTSTSRTIISGLVQFYKPEELKDQLVIVACNMKPKKLVGVESHGMVLCASTPDAVKIIQPPPTAKPGDCVAFGKNIAAAVPNKAIPSSNKMMQLLEGLRTDAEGVCMWKDVPLTVGGEAFHAITAPLKNVQVK